MRMMVVMLVLPLFAVCWSSCDCDCMKKVTEKDQQITDLSAKVADLEQKIAGLEGAAKVPEEPVANQASGPSPATLDACLERLRACEQDPFKGPKYFSPEKVEPGKGPKPAVPADLIDPFAGKQKPASAKGELVDPFSKK